jgi:TP901 family phage tail tape measure protein
MPQPQVEILIKATTQGFTKVLDELDKLKRAMNLINQTGAVQSVNNLSAQLGSLSKTVVDLTNKMDKYNTSLKQQQQATQGGIRSLLTMQMTLKSYINDVLLMISVQARWYGARMLLFAAVELPFSAIKSIFDYTVALDTARSELLRFAATSGSTTKQMVTDAEVMVLGMRRALINVPVSFKEISEAIQAFVGAGVAPDTIVKITEYVAKLKNAFPEIEMKTFATALTGAFNQFGDSIKSASSDAEKFRVIMETLLRAQAVGIIRPEQFTKVLQYMGPISSMAGLTLQQMAAMAVVITDMGRRAESASRLAAGFLNSLIQPRAAANLASIGIELDKNKTLAAQLGSIATQLIEKIGTGAVPLGSLQFITGLTSSDRLGVFVSFLQNYEKYVALTKDLEGSTGGLDAASKAMTMSLAKQWQLLINILKEVGQVLTEDTGGALHYLLGVLVEISKGLLLVADSSGKLAVKVDELGIAATAAALTFLTLRTLAEGVYAAFVAVGWAVNGWVAAVFQGLEKIFRFIHLDSMADFAKDMKDQMYAATAVSVAELATLRDKWLNPSSAPYALPGVTPVPKTGRTTVTGTGIEAPDTGRLFDQKIIANIKRSYNALYSMEQSELKTSLDQMNVLYRFGVISVEQYYKDKEELLKKYEQRELDILDREKKELEEGFATLRRGIEKGGAGKKKLTPEEQKRALTELAETEESEFLALAAKRQQTEERIAQRRIQNLIETNDRLAAATKKRLEDERNLEVESSREIEIISRSSIERRQAKNEWLYKQNYIEATTFYNAEKLLMEEQAETAKAFIDARFQAELRRLDELQLQYGINDERWKDIQRDKTVLIAKNSNDILAIEEELAKRIENLNRARSEDLRALYEDEGFLGITKKSLRDLIGEFSNTGKALTEMWADVAKTMSTTMSDLFFDVMTGDLKSLEDYLKSMLNGMARALSNIWSQMIMNYVLQSARSGLSNYFPSIFGTGGTNGGLTAPPEITGVTTNLHLGGTIGSVSGTARSVPLGTFAFAPRLHSGLASGEFPAILQTGETVLKRGESKSLSQNVKVQIVNESGQAMQVKNSEAKFNGQEYVVSVWLDAMKNNKFGLRNALGA